MLAHSYLDYEPEWKELALSCEAMILRHHAGPTSGCESGPIRAQTTVRRPSRLELSQENSVLSVTSGIRRS